MTIKATKFTPEVLLSAPRRSAGLPNSNGDKVLYSVSTYSFAEHSKRSEIRVLDVETQQTTLLTDESNASEPNWIDNHHVLLLCSGNEGETKVKVGKVDDFSKSYDAGTIDGPAANVKIVPISGGDKFAIAFSAQSTPSGEIYNPEKAKKPLTTGKLYKSLFVRHWDHYVTENRSTIFIGKLKNKNKSSSSEPKYELVDVRNALKGAGLESPIPAFGGTDHFDISSKGLIFTAKDPDLDPATHTKTNIYFISQNNFWDTYADSIRSPQKVEIFGGFDGASTSPVFSRDGNMAAFLSMRTDGYESDKNQVFVVPDVTNPNWVIHLYASKDGKGTWDRSPQSITWSIDGKWLYLLAEDHGRVCLYAAQSDALPNAKSPQLLARGGAISDIRPLSNGDLFLSSSSLIDSSIYSVFQCHTLDTQVVSTLSQSGSKFGLSPHQVDEVYWPGAAKDTSVHAWVVKPSTFNSSEKYPLAYLIHGGPQGAWEDAWSTRWNPAVFAEQGYVVICPNPTGSTGYGQAFTDAIKEQWGGLPYEDLVKGFEWIEKNLDYVDTNKAVALGASYGGYMMNWIQGHPLGRRFRALVTHDGVFSMTAQLASDELYFPFHDLGGTYWSHPSNWHKWDPSRFTQNWSTPHLIIHSELDYRLTIAEGLAAFNVLQARGIESQFLMFPDENHWVLKPENSLKWHEVVLDWINGKVGLPAYTESRKMIEEGE